MTIRILWDNKPLSDTEVKLFNGKGDEKTSQKTNAKGEVEFTDAQVEDGQAPRLLATIRGALGVREIR